MAFPPILFMDNQIIKIMKAFLTAEWRNLINITYQVPPTLLMPYLPEHTTLDVKKGSAFVSLVAFEFLNTKVKGLKIPFHVNFPEINLRFYVLYKGKRAVVFIKEFVPKFCIALVANRVYNEPYEAIPMHTQIEKDTEEIKIYHRIEKQGKTGEIWLSAKNKLSTPPINSTEHYFKEHDLGLGKDKKGKTLSYEVKHPIWEVYPVENHYLNFDFGHFYGEQWAFLKDEKPYNVLLAKGSDVEVLPLNKITS